MSKGKPKKYWIKLYLDILDDMKLASLCDSEFALMVKLFCLAGEVNEDGFLPADAQMAWRLRSPNEESLRRQLSNLAAIGILEQREYAPFDMRWYITHFAERQAPSTDAQRMREMRKRKKEAKKEKERKELQIQNTDNILLRNDFRTVSVTHVTKRNADDPILELVGEFERVSGCQRPNNDKALADLWLRPLVSIYRATGDDFQKTLDLIEPACLALYGKRMTVASPKSIASTAISMVRFERVPAAQQNGSLPSVPDPATRVATEY